MDGHRNILFLIAFILMRETIEYEITNFVSSPALEGHTCGTDDNISQRMILKLLMCVSLCAVRSDCQSLFYNSSTSMCVLCRVQNNMVTDQPLQPGFVCFNKVNNFIGEVYLGEDCSNNETCLNSKMLCYNTTLTCLCNSYRQYNRTNDVCEVDCVRPGIGFDKYSERLPYKRGSMYSRITSSVDECMNECIRFTNITCNGFGYNETSGHCLLYEKIGTVVASEIDTYVRQCF